MELVFSMMPRHSMQLIYPALYSENAKYNVSNMGQYRTENFNNMIDALYNSNPITVLVSGFTPATVDLICEVMDFASRHFREGVKIGSFKLGHWNPNSKEYDYQVIFN